MQAIKNAEISIKILEKIAEGMTVRQAIDTVLGAGTAEKIAGEVYDEIRVRHG